MSRTRRALTVLALMAGLMTVSLPASASFQDTAALARTTISTGTVSAPATITFSNLRCYQVQTGGGYTDANGVWIDPTYTWKYQVTVSWPAPLNTKGVTGYRIMANMGGHIVDMGVTPTRTMSSGELDRALIDYYRPQIYLITQTSYGWVSQPSASFPVPTC